MRYQLRYIRERRARSSPSAKVDNSRPTGSRTNPRFTGRDDRIQRKCTRVLVFDLGKTPPSRCARRSRGSVGERPLHTRKVAGSIPAGTTTNVLLDSGFPALRCSGFI